MLKTFEQLVQIMNWALIIIIKLFCVSFALGCYQINLYSGFQYVDNISCRDNINCTCDYGVNGFYSTFYNPVGRMYLGRFDFNVNYYVFDTLNYYSNGLMTMVSYNLTTTTCSIIQSNPLEYQCNLNNQKLLVRVNNC